MSKKDCRVLAAPFDVYLDDLVNKDIHDCFQPDISVICDEDKLRDDGCHGAPDWIIEILSPSSESRDLGIKRKKYHAAGIREYWVVDPIRRIVIVFAFENEKFTCVYSFDDTIEVSICPGFTIRLTDMT